MAQIAAEELGLPLKDIEISAADTEFTPFCFGAFGNRLTIIAGNAVRWQQPMQSDSSWRSPLWFWRNPTNLLCEGEGYL